MWTYAEHAHLTPAIIEVETVTSAKSAAKAHDPMRSPQAPQVRTSQIADAERGVGWRDIVQSFVYDAAEMPIYSRLLVGQAVLGLGCLGLCAALVLRERVVAHRLPTWPLGVVAAGAAVAYAWGALALISRTRAVPAITASFTYGHALSQYVGRRQSPARAA